MTQIVPHRTDRCRDPPGGAFQQFDNPGREARVFGAHRLELARERCRLAEAGLALCLPFGGRAAVTLLLRGLSAPDDGKLLFGRDLAMAYIRDTELAFGEIAWLLGFSSAEAFQRAFKRWSGQTPGEFRRRQRRADV